jgi:hypothetical protein
MAQDRGETVLAIEDITHRAHTEGAHGLAAIAAKAGGVHIGMDSALHGILLPSNSALAPRFRRGN